MRAAWAAALVAACAAHGSVAAQADLRVAVQRALDRARPALMEHLRRSSGQEQWRSRDLDGLYQRPGQLALLCLAALHDGVPTDEPVLEQAMERLSRARSEMTYDCAVRLMVLEAWPGFPDREKVAKADLRVLVRNQAGGGFGYGPGQGGWDLSNTQYAALGLRAAESVGLDVPGKVWRELAVAVARGQDSDGSFGYSAGADGYPSMTVAGIAVLEICSQALSRTRNRPAGLERRVKAAWEWMERNAAAIGNESERHCLYFHYGLERAAILSDVERIGTTDWYETGAGMLVASQLGGGGWVGAGGFARPDPLPPEGLPVDTAFAILFLRRQFQKVAGPLTGPRGLRLGELDEQSGDDDIQEAARTAWSRGVASMPQVLLALRSEVAARRQAAALALFRLAGEDFGFNPHRDQEHNAEAIRKAELWYLKNR